MKELIRKIFSRSGEQESIKPSKAPVPSFLPETSRESLIVLTPSDLKFRIEQNLEQAQEDIETLRSLGFKVETESYKDYARFEREYHRISDTPYTVTVTKTTIEEI